MQHSPKQSGFFTMILILLLILISVIGFAFMRVLKANQ
jgi:hypothetical protein